MYFCQWCSTVFQWSMQCVLSVSSCGLTIPLVLSAAPCVCVCARTCCSSHPAPKSVPPKMFIATQNLSPPRLTGHFAKLYTPFEPPSVSLSVSTSSPSTTPEWARTHFLVPQKICQKVYQEDHQVQGLPPALQRLIQNLNLSCSQHKPKRNDKRRSTCSTSPKFTPQWPYGAFCQDLYPGVYILGRGCSLSTMHSTNQWKQH